jgi:hypothetical protein
MQLTDFEKLGYLADFGNRLESFKPLEEGSNLFPRQATLGAIAELVPQLVAAHGIIPAATDEIVDASRQTPAVL